MANDPLTQNINALTAYANGLTGESDTNLSDAVASLGAGYGGGGGGYSASDILCGAAPSGDVSFETDANIPAYAISGRTAITSLTIKFTGSYSIAGYAIYKNNIPKIHLIGRSGLSMPSYMLNSNVDSNNKIVVVCSGTWVDTDTSSFRGNPGLKTVDYSYAGGGAYGIRNNCFFQSPLLDTLIIRDNYMPLNSASQMFSGAFENGGSGGTLYVPNDLISTYQSANNWSTILGYANNQIKSIESTHTDPTAPIDLTLYYADGTPIS